MTDLIIAPKVEGKGRTFRAIRVAQVTASRLWEAGQTDTGDIARPVFAVLLGSEAEMRPFVANLQLGRQALVAPDRQYGRDAKKGIEFLKSAKYKYLWQREDEGAIVTVYLPDLFAVDPGMVDPKEVKFVLLPSREWAASQTLPVDEIVDYALRLPLVEAFNAKLMKDRWDNVRPHEPELPRERLASMVATAYLFAAYLDRRSRAPLPADGRFYLQLLLACLKAGLATWNLSSNEYRRRDDKLFGEHSDFGFRTDGLAEAGMLPGIAFQAEHEKIEALLAEECSTFFAMTGEKKPTGRTKKRTESK